STERYRFDAGAALVPEDFALGWGRMSDSAVLQQIDITQSARFYYWSVRQFPIPRREIETHSANMHLIPADAGVRRALAHLADPRRYRRRRLRVVLRDVGRCTRRAGIVRGAIAARMPGRSVAGML